MKIASFLSLAVLSLCASTGLAQDLSLQSRAYTHSCGYYSSRSVDFRLQFRDLSVPWGSRVKLRYGFGGTKAVSSSGESKSQVLEWEHSQTVELNATAPYLWESSVLTQTVSVRSSPINYTKLQFVVEVEQPYEVLRVIRGSESEHGYFEAAFDVENSSCVSSSTDVESVPMRALGLRSVVK